MRSWLSQTTFTWRISYLMFIYTPVDRAISAFLRTIFSSTGSGIYIWHFSVLQVRDNHFCRRRWYCCSLLSPQPRESPCRNGLPASRSWMVAPHFPRRWHSVVLRDTCQMPSSHSTTLCSTSSPFSFSSLAGIPNPRWMPFSQNSWQMCISSCWTTFKCGYFCPMIRRRGRRESA